MLLSSKATFASNRNTPACCAVFSMLLESQEYVAAMAATEITIMSSVARIGDTALFEIATANILGAHTILGA